MDLKKAVAMIEKNGALLVFPILNSKVPPSLWSCLYPRSEMKWEWDSGGDDRVARLWHLRAELSNSDQVVYSKWYRGRATFFSRDVFVAMMTLAGTTHHREIRLSPDADHMLEILEGDSPLSTKALKKQAELQGKFYEGRYTKGLRELWEKFLIVGYGEIDDGAFPSLAVGATKNIFEDLYQESLRQKEDAARQLLRNTLSEESAFFKFLEKIDKKKKSSKQEFGEGF